MPATPTPRAAHTFRGCSESPARGSCSHASTPVPAGWGGTGSMSPHPCHSASWQGQLLAKSSWRRGGHTRGLQVRGLLYRKEAPPAPRAHSSGSLPARGLGRPDQALSQALMTPGLGGAAQGSALPCRGQSRCRAGRHPGTCRVSPGLAADGRPSPGTRTEGRPHPWQGAGRGGRSLWAGGSLLSPPWPAPLPPESYQGPTGLGSEVSSGCPSVAPNTTRVHSCPQQFFGFGFLGRTG